LISYIIVLKKTDAIDEIFFKEENQMKKLQDQLKTVVKSLTSLSKQVEKISKQGCQFPVYN